MGSPAGQSYELPPEDVEAQQPPGDPEAVARVICLRMLDRKARSRSELADALVLKGIPDDAATRVLDRFTDVGLIDDAALAEAMTASAHRERGLARRAVAAKLRQRGIADDVAGAAVDGLDAAQERRRAIELVTRRRRSLAALPPEVQTRRLVGLLARKGYPQGMAFEVVRAVVRDEADESCEALD